MSMNISEITGQPCSGKSTYISTIFLNNQDHETNNGGFIQKFYFFFNGVIYLETFRIRKLLEWSLKEDASIFFKLNIFRNAVSKFGMFNKRHVINKKKSRNFMLDESISHLPFLFLETDTNIVVEFMLNELQQVNVVFLKSPGKEKIKERLEFRGHKRLRFLPTAYFVSRNDEIEETLIHCYTNICQDFKVI